MNLRIGPHHKICGLLQTRWRALPPGSSALPQSSEAGYTLVALLALMTVLALFALAAAPSIQQQAQREREKEAIFRGEQMAQAIRDYYIYRLSTGGGVGDQSLPTSIDQLLEGVPTGRTKKLQVLRASAARDPLSDDGEWRLVRPASMEMADFTRAIMLYSENIRPATRA